MEEREERELYTFSIFPFPLYSLFKLVTGFVTAALTA